MVLNFLPQVISWAVLKTSPLLRLRGAPEGPNVRRYGTAVLRIAHPQLVFLRCLDLDFPQEKLMDVLRVPAEEIEKLKDTQPLLATALSQRRPPTNWIRNASGEIPEVFLRAALRLEPKELEKILVTEAQMKPMDWLVDTALDRSRFFPEPMELRRMFTDRLPCADGEQYVATTKEN